MENQELLQEYVNKEVAKGINLDDLKKTLKNAGWGESQVNTVLKKAKSGNETPEDSFTDTKPKKHLVNGRGIKILLILLLVVFAGVGLYFYFYIYLAPEKLISRSLQKMQGVNTYEFLGRVNISTSDMFPDNQNVGRSDAQNYQDYLPSNFPDNFIVGFSGGVDSSISTNTKSYLKINIQGNDTALVDLEMRNLNKKLYVILNKLVDLGIVDTQALLNKWVMFDIEELTKDNTELIPPEQQDFNFTEEEKREFWDTLQRTPIFSAVEKLRSEQVEGVSSYHFRFKINKSNLKIVLIKLYEITSGEAFSENQRLETEKTVGDFLSEVNFEDVEIWVGKKDLFIHRLKTGLSSTDGGYEVKFDITLKNYNQPVNVIAPTDYYTFQEMFAEIFGGYDTPAEMEETPIESEDMLLPADEFNLEALPSDYQRLMDISKGETAGFSTER